MADLPPQNELEQALADGREGRLPMPDFLKLLLRSPLYVLSGSEPKEDGSGFEPLIYPHPEEGDPMIACYSSPQRIGEAARKAPFMFQVICGEFLERLPETTIGVVINPGDEQGFELRSPAIQSLVQAIKARRTN
ncbi:MAG: SseB family protein [Caulobacteraceae bacterium]|nr:SseB family protein [Caulobacteraceae bacterium]